MRKHRLGRIALHGALLTGGGLAVANWGGLFHARTAAAEALPELVVLLGQRHRNVCVVGDDAQSIYSFRGATIQNILQFQKDYDDAAVIKLEQNYRSTQTILDVAGAVVNPGVYPLPADARWIDAIEVAGGVTADRERERERPEGQERVESCRVHVLKDRNRLNRPVGAARGP